jgi:hypothetical protein
MTMPTKAKTWTHSANNRIVFSTFLDTHQQLLQALKEMAKAIPGATVKGSGDNVAAAMDGTDRIGAAGEWARAGAITSVHSWIVITFANMGGAELLIDYVGSTDDACKLSYSPGGLFVINATNPRYTPAASDELYLIGTSTAGASFGSNVTNGDRIWTTAYATDGSALTFLVARAGSWITVFTMQAVTSAVLAPATFTPAVVATASNAAPTIASWYGGSVWKARVNAINVTLPVSMESANSQAISSLFTTVLELQSSQWPIMALGLWCLTVGARGKVCNLIDVWAGNVAAADGDTYPNDATRLFIAVGDFVFPWNGSAVVMS